MKKKNKNKNIAVENSTTETSENPTTNQEGNAENTAISEENPPEKTSENSLEVSANPEEIMLNMLTASVNKRGKPTGNMEVMLNDDGLAIGATDDGKAKRLKGAPKFLADSLEAMAEAGNHFVLQRSEGVGIKVVGKDGKTHAVIMFRGKHLSVYCLKANRQDAVNLLEKIGVEASDKFLSMRSNDKSENVYVDFTDSVSPELVAKFVSDLPASATCTCGHELCNPPGTKSTRETKAKKPAKTGSIHVGEKTDGDEAPSETTTTHVKKKKPKEDSTAVA